VVSNLTFVIESYLLIKRMVMNRRTLIPVLLVVALASLVYAIYRSTEEKVTLLGPDRQTVFGEPQHGLILGLCIFAGLCVVSLVPLLLDKRDDVRSDRTRDRITTTTTRREDDPIIRRNL
jgi:hypothetical protein